MSPAREMAERALDDRFEMGDEDAASESEESFESFPEENEDSEASWSS